MTEKEATKANEISLQVKSQTKKKHTIEKADGDILCEIRVRFIYEGERLKETDTPESLGMEEGDEIDAMVEQHGG